MSAIIKKMYRLPIFAHQKTIVQTCGIQIHEYTEKLIFKTLFRKKSIKLNVNKILKQGFCRAFLVVIWGTLILKNTILSQLFFFVSLFVLLVCPISALTITHTILENPLKKFHCFGQYFLGSEKKWESFPRESWTSFNLEFVTL